MSYSEKLTLNLVYYSKKVYSKVTLDISMKCKNHRGGKMKNLLDFYFVTCLVISSFFVDLKNVF